VSPLLFALLQKKRYLPVGEYFHHARRRRSFLSFFIHRHFSLRRISPAGVHYVHRDREGSFSNRSGATSSFLDSLTTPFFPPRAQIDLKGELRSPLEIKASCPWIRGYPSIKRISAAPLLLDRVFSPPDLYWRPSRASI